MSDKDKTTKQRLKTGLKTRTIEEIFSFFKKQVEEKQVDLSKGSGFVSLDLLAGQEATVRIKYPALCFKAMGITGDAEIEKAIKALDITSKELFIPYQKAREKDAAGVSNRLQGFSDRKIIGKRVTFELPEKIQRAEAKGQKQLYVSTRIPGFVPVLSVGILQAWLNSTVSDEAKKIKWLYGPSRAIRYAVPVDAAAITAAIKEVAKTVEIA